MKVPASLFLAAAFFHTASHAEIIAGHYDMAAVRDVSTLVVAFDRRHTEARLHLESGDSHARPFPGWLYGSGVNQTSTVPMVVPSTGRIHQ